MPLTSPKYTEGETVYFPSVISTKKQLSCPDCLGLKVWNITTPAGSQMEMPCQRCSSSYHDRDIPSLDYMSFEPVISTLTIGSITVTTHPYVGDDLIKYMCRETGIGSGQVFNQRDLYHSKDLAQTVAQQMADEKNAAAESQPERIQLRSISKVQFRPGIIQAAWDACWHHSYHFESLRNDLKEALDVEGKPQEEIIDEIQNAIDRSDKYRTAPPMVEFLKLLKSTPDLTAKVLADFPEIFKVVA